MNKYIKAILIGSGLIIGGIVILVLFFVQGMKPDKSKEKEVRLQAEQYLAANFENDDYEIYDVLYDNMGNYGYFDYAAKVRNQDGSKVFLIYYNKDREQLEDSLTVEKQADYIMNEVKPLLMAYMNDQFGEEADPSVKYSISEGKAAITIRLSRNKEDRDGELFANVISYVKEDLKLEHAYITMFYTTENQDDVWEENY